MVSFSKITLGDLTEFHRVLDAAGFTPEVIRKINKNPSLADTMLAATRSNAPVSPPRKQSSQFAAFKQVLNSLAEQKVQLTAFNAQAGDLAVSSQWLEGLSTTSRHVQCLEDLEVFVVWCGTLEATFRYGMALMKFSQGNIWDSKFKKDAANMRLHKRAFGYAEAGVYRVRVNLVDNWTPGKSRSVKDVYDLAAAKPDYILASVEPIFAYALQKSKLICHQDGTILAYTNCPGIQQGDGFAEVVCFYWLSYSEGVLFFSFGAGTADTHFSAPSLQEVPQKVA